MKRALTLLRDLALDVVRAARDRALEILRSEPVRVAAVVAAVLVALGVIDVTAEAGAVAKIAEVIGVLVGGEGLRQLVYSPATVDRIVKLAERAARG